MDLSEATRKRMAKILLISLWMFCGLSGGFLIYLYGGVVLAFLVWALIFDTLHSPAWFHLLFFCGLVASVMFITWVYWRKVFYPKASEKIKDALS